MKDSLVLHHAAINDDKPQAQRIIAAHLRNPKIKQKGGYHWVIERNGLAVQLHPEDFTGNHAGNWRINVRSIGICLAGDLRKQEPTYAQVSAFTKLLTDIQMRWGIPDSNIYLHREVRLEPTECPAIDLRELYLENRELLLRTKIERLKQAQNRATGTRLERIKRMLARLLP